MEVSGLRGWEGLQGLGTVEKQGSKKAWEDRKEEGRIRQKERLGEQGGHGGKEKTGQTGGGRGRKEWRRGGKGRERKEGRGQGPLLGQVTRGSGEGTGWVT